MCMRMGEGMGLYICIGCPRSSEMLVFFFGALQPRCCRFSGNGELCMTVCLVAASWWFEASDSVQTGLQDLSSARSTDRPRMQSGVIAG